MNRVITERKMAETAESKIYDPVIGVNFEDTVFFLAKANAFESPLTVNVYPLELSVVAFSIRKGVLDVFSTLIDHEDMRKCLPSGSAVNAKDVTEETGLPPVGDSLYKQFCIGTSDSLLTQLQLFMEFQNASPSADGKQYILAMPNDMDHLIGSLDQLCEIAGTKEENPELQNFRDSIQVLDMSKVLYRCAKRVNVKSPQYCPHMVQFQLVPLAEDLLNSPRYNYNTGITCKYHAHEDVTSKADKCSKNNVLRRAFIFLEEMVIGLGIEPSVNHKVHKFVGTTPRRSIKNKTESSGDLRRQLLLEDDQ